MNKEVIDKVIQPYIDEKHLFERFMNAVVDTFRLEPELNKYGNPIIYTIKNRLKDVDHLRGKIERKWDEEDPLTPDNLFEKVTDLAGVRVLHLYQDQFSHIHNLIQKQLDNGDWFLRENPVAYSWDPESSSFFKQLGLESKVKDSYYTSIHYVVKPKEDSNICCEIQVRTLFEEIWGEIDHTINYPHPTEKSSCKEQLRVLSKLVSTGTRLADSIFRTHNE
ncbi:(p)ppGpp synthetase [Oceanisphaera profunda]|uniref:(P)ppGpp synthetase n=1 Tax=Oceanisphaera profunda TaxID=1416627 RepID=A0A1Y0D229_9GAMM|nr:RelA/SpoT domain-containing protein [Oceanisphaera profunda]ART81571.1 (p)ppGpp synthetase [Oceanisphaera profunda]